jgi:hypothetical protein
VFQYSFVPCTFVRFARKAFGKQGKGGMDWERERERGRRVLLLCVRRNSRRIFEYQKWECLKIWEEDLGEENTATVAKEKKQHIFFGGKDSYDFLLEKQDFFWDFFFVSLLCFICGGWVL